MERLPRRSTRFVLMRTRAWLLHKERAHLLCFLGQTREKAVRSAAVQAPPLDILPPLPDLTAETRRGRSTSARLLGRHVPQLHACHACGAASSPYAGAAVARRLRCSLQLPLWFGLQLVAFQVQTASSRPQPLRQSVATPLSTEFRDAQPHSASPPHGIANGHRNNSCPSLPQRRSRHGRPS